LPKTHNVETRARDEILALCNPQMERPERLLVHFVTIQHGKKVSVQDPWKNKWLSYDPLASVGFFNPKEEEGGHGMSIKHLKREDVGKMYIPVGPSFASAQDCI